MDTPIPIGPTLEYMERSPDPPCHLLRYYLAQNDTEALARCMRGAGKGTLAKLAAQLESKEK
jgi:hypothetical protein